MQSVPVPLPAHPPVDPAALAEDLRGAVLLPGSEAYEQARPVWNLVHDRRPAAIVQAQSAEDVAAAVRFARGAGLEIAVRSGGHSMAGFSTGDGVLVIDMRALRGLHIDTDTALVSAEAGLTAGDVTTALVPHELAIPFGDTATVGIAGLTLGGGIGYLARSAGLAIDRLRGMEVVTADGTIVVTSADRHPDLFWALRGGGGNFGIVTRFVYEAVHVGETLSGLLVMPLTTDVLRGILSVAASAPDQLTTILELMPAPPAPFIPPDAVGTPVVMVLLVYAGDPAAGQHEVDRLRAIATPIADLVSPMPYGGIYQFSAEAEVPAPAITRTMFAPALDDRAIDRIVRQVAEPGRPMLSITQLRVLGGAMGRVARDATAFAHREANVMLTVYSILVDPTRAADDARWTVAYFAGVSAGATGAYVNFLEEEGADRIGEAYPPDTYRRLAEAKRRWDPENVFRRNQNVPPA